MLYRSDLSEVFFFFKCDQQLVPVTVGVTCTGGDPESDSESVGESNICLLEKGRVEVGYGGSGKQLFQGG